MSKLLTRTKSSVAAKRLAANLGGKFEAAQTSVSGTVVGANLVSVGGQQYRSIGIDGDAGASVAVRNIGTPAVAVYGPAMGGAALASVGSGGGNTSSGGDHNPVALATPSGLQFADTLTQLGLALAAPRRRGCRCTRQRYRCARCNGCRSWNNQRPNDKWQNVHDTEN